MSDHPKETQGEEEIAELAFSEFLESRGPNQEFRISDLTVLKVNRPQAAKVPGTGYVGVGVRIEEVSFRMLKTPEIHLHCSNETCQGMRVFRNSEKTEVIFDKQNPTQQLFLVYRCSNCQRSTKTFAVRLTAALEKGAKSGLAVKFGELPPFGPPTPSRLVSLIGPDRDALLKGRRCENQSLGIGAFVYYRRVVENQKARILGEIRKVAEKIGVDQGKIDILAKAEKETQFSRALTMAKDAIPESLLINGHNPLALLHGALSEGVHAMSDDECLEIAGSIRVVLGELSERLTQALKDEAELKHALSSLMNRKKHDAESGESKD